MQTHRSGDDDYNSMRLRRVQYLVHVHATFRITRQSIISVPVQLDDAKPARAREPLELLDPLCAERTWRNNDRRQARYFLAASEMDLGRFYR
jgi:hypothetical protein